MLSRAVRVSFLALLFGILYVGVALPAIVVFNDQAAFIAATSGPTFVSSLINFDSAAIPTVIGNNTSFQGVTFQQSQNFVGSDLVITDGTNTGTFVGPQLPTTSGTRYLGNTVNAQLVAGRHNFTMQFGPQSNIRAAGMSLIASGTPANIGIQNGEIQLSVNGGAASLNTALIQQTLNAGTATESQVFFLGLYNDAGLLGDMLVSTTGIADAFRFRIDDVRLVAVPEPSSLGVLGLAGALLASRRLMRGKLSITFSKAEHLN